MSWASRRKGLYLSVVLLLVLGFVGGLSYLFLSRAPSCADGSMNGRETGIDCGGACDRLCAEETRDPVFLWARSFRVAPGLYTAAAYIENPNTGAGSMRAPYVFRLYDADNILVMERRGVTFLPPQRFVPIVEANIETGNRVPVRALFEFTEPLVFDVMPSVRVSVDNETFDAQRSRLEARVSNVSGEDVRNLVVAVVLFDASGVAQAASKSVIALIPRGASEQVVFTWPSGLPQIARIEITPLSP